jgi:mannosyltransferase OCH1-like enzyme
MSLAKLIQFWDARPPPEVADLMDGWQRLNPDFEYLRFDEIAAEQFISDNFGPAYLRAFRSCALPAMKSDYFRYCALYALGGLYVDAGTQCVRPASLLTTTVGRGLLLSVEGRVINRFMYFRNRNDVLMEHAIAAATRNIAARLSNNVWEVTGPGILTRLYNETSPTRDEAFRDISIVETRNTKPYFLFRWDLDYKRNASHWSRRQAVASIFTSVDE